MSIPSIIPTLSCGTPKERKLVWAHELDDDLSQSWLVDKMIPTTGLVVVYGGPGTGKTYFMVNLMLSITHGVRFCEQATQPGITVLVAGEGLSGLQRRVAAWYKSTGLRIEDSNLLLLKGAIQLLDKDELGDLVASIKTMVAGRKVNLIAFDTLSRCFVKGDENSQASMSEAVDNCDQVGEAFECPVALLHHTNKSGNNAPRGSSVLSGAADTMIFISRTSQGLDAKIEKQKEEQSGHKFRFKLDPQIIGQDEAGQDVSVPVATFLAREDERAPANDNRPKGRVQAALLDLINSADGEAVSPEALYDQATRGGFIGGEKPRRAFSTAIEALISDSFIVKTEDGYIAG